LVGNAVKLAHEVTSIKCSLLYLKVTFLLFCHRKYLSWGPDDDGKVVDGPGPLAWKAFENGIENVRDC
jgi:hypothetical protein